MINSKIAHRERHGRYDVEEIKNIKRKKDAGYDKRNFFKLVGVGAAEDGKKQYRQKDTEKQKTYYSAQQHRAYADRVGYIYRDRHERVAEHQKVIHADVKTQERVSATKVLVTEDNKHEYGDKNRAPCQRTAVPVEHEQVARETSETKLQYQQKEKRLGHLQPAYPEPKRGAPQGEEE